MLGIDKPGRGAADVGVGVGGLRGGRKGRGGKENVCMGGYFWENFQKKKNFVDNKNFQGGRAPHVTPQPISGAPWGGLLGWVGVGVNFFCRGGIFSEEGIKKNF